MKYYNILEWVDMFEKDNGVVDPKEDFLESNSTILYPGRFYMLQYMATQTKERFNARPVILSMGLSKKDPKSFLCVDLSVMPYPVRRRFIEMYFDTYYNTITSNIDEYLYTEDADKQKGMVSFSYDNFCKSMPTLPIKYAVKRYKIENTLKIYSIPYQQVYKVIGKFCDQNYYVNGTIRDVQNEFIKKVQQG